ncbi:MAG: AAA family ATPase [Anaerolineae bacterium]|nr:AAA family ATPase [Anaerolineae bacterium]
MPDTAMPITYRTEVLEPLVSWLRMGESCSIVGVGGTGKSNLARFLIRPEVRERYFGPHAHQTLVVYVNCHECALRPPEHLYLAILDRLCDAIAKTGGTLAAVLPTISALVKEAETRPDLLAKRYLSRAFDQVVQSDIKHLVMILDDCDDLFRQAPAYLFSDLRAFRDDHKVVLVYVTTSQHQLASLRLNTPEYTKFFELFSAAGHTIALPPYSEDDALAMIQRLAARHEPPLTISATQAQRMYALSGGHPGLLRAIFFVAQRGVDVTAADVIERMLQFDDIQKVCQKIWNSLEPEEQNRLQDVLRRKNISADDLQHLERRGLMRLRFGTYAEFTSPLLERFVGGLIGLMAGREPPIEFIEPNAHVRVYGQLITTLTRVEYEILRHLFVRRPQVCPYSDLIEVMRLAEHREPTVNVHGHPLRRLEQYIQQIKAKLGPASVLIQSTSDGYRMSE